MKTYYKVVSQHNKALYSAILPNNFEYAQPIRYRTNKWVKPKIAKSKLMVFDNLDAAFSFANQYLDKVVYKCEIKNPTKQIKEIVNLHYFSPHNFWKNNRNCLSESWFVSSYTVFCDEVKLTKKVRQN